MLVASPIVAFGAAADEGQTAEQSFKNIQVLKGIPSEELIPAMTFMEGALGVQCAFCHDTAGRYPQGYEKDEIRAKQTAREMMRMTKQINDTSFQGRAVVTCASCHNGHEHPQPAAPIATAEMIQQRLAEAAARTRAVQGQPAPAGGLPTAEELFAKYETAIGGDAAISKLTSRHVLATITAANGQVSKVEVFYKSSGDLFVQHNTARTPVTVGFDGTHVYRAVGPDVQAVTGASAEEFKLAGLFYRNLRLKDLYTQARTLGKEKIGDKDVYVVRAVMKVERYTDLLSFDANSGLLLRRITLNRSVLGQSAAATDFENYRDVDGVKVAMDSTQSSSADPPRKVHYEEVRFNVPFDDAKFAMPAAQNQAIK
jgi:hypothetical protein